MITLGAVLPSLIAKLNLSGLQTTSLVTFLPLGMLAGSLIFGPIVDRFGHKAPAGAQLHHRTAGDGRTCLL